MVSSTGRFLIYVIVAWQWKRSIFRLRLWSPCRRSFPFSLARAQIPPSPSLFNPCHAGYSQSEVIVDAKVSDRQRRCCAPWRNIIGCESSFTCHVLLVFAFCLVGCSSTWDLRGFSAEPKWYLLLCYTLLWFKRHCLGILQSVDLLWCNSCTFWAVSWISVIDLDW